MKKLLFQSGVLLLLLAVMSTGHSHPKQTRVKCDKGHSIQRAVDKIKKGASIVVHGTCNEAVVINKDDVQIFAINDATIIPPADSNAFLLLDANNVLIAGFNILGGTIGVHIANGSSATVVNNHILDSTVVGIGIRGASYANVANNNLSSTSGNFSQIFVTGSSSADIFDNTITASSGGGIGTDGASHADVTCNNVSNTAGAGIQIQSNSNMLFRASCPNIVNNPAGEAFRCTKSGSVGVQVAQDFTGAVILDPDCEVSLSPGVIFP